MYHKVAIPGPGAKVRSHYVHPSAFSRQLRLLNALRYGSVRPAEAPRASEREVAITFDDGYENFLLHAVPILLQNHRTATVFVVTGLLGRTDEWDNGSEPLMNLHQVLTCANQGFEVGSHTCSHADLAGVEPTVATREIQESRAFLIESGIADPGFCYPYGRHNPAVREMVKAAGYAYACGTSRGKNDASTDIFDLHRINIRADTSLPIFLFKLLRARPLRG